MDIFTLASLEEAIMLDVDFEEVLDLEDLAHPGGAEVLELLFFFLFAVFVHGKALLASVFAHDCFRCAVEHICGFIRAVFLHQRNLELEVLLLFGLGSASLFLHGLQISDESIIRPTKGLSTAQLPVQLKLVRFDRLVAL